MARAAGSPEVEALALGVRGRTLAMHGRVDDGIESLRAAVAIADAVGNLHGQVVGHAMIVAVLARCGRSRAALEEADAALAVADASGVGRSLGASLTADAARACFAFGAWDDADRRIADGLARRPPALAEASLLIVGLRLAAARGLDDATPALLDRLGALEPVLAAAGDVASLDVARAELALARDVPAEVRPLGDRALAAVAGGAGRTSSLAWLGVLALQAEIDLCLDARGRGDEPAAELAERRIAAIAAVGEREATEALGPWGERATALVAQFEAERGRIDREPAGRAAAWERAIAAWEAIERPYFAAYGRYRLAEAMLAAGDGREAIAVPLRHAAGSLASLGARPLLARVERLARLAHVGLGREAVRVPDRGVAGDPLATLDLTPREREVLRLVAAGWPNARIADELGISVKTASVHVSNILAKLGVENRVEAAALAHRLGVVG